LGLLLLGSLQSVQRGGDTVEGVKQQPAAARHALGAPLSIENREFDHPVRARFDAASIRTDVNRDMVHITWDETTHQPPELTGQDIWLAVHRADDVARLQRNSFNLVRVNRSHGN